MPNKQINDLFWAFVIAILCASVLGAIGFLFPRPDAATQAIFRLSDSLVTGALGFFAGRAMNFKSGDPKGPEPPTK